MVGSTKLVLVSVLCRGHRISVFVTGVVGTDGKVRVDATHVERLVDLQTSGQRGVCYSIGG